MPEALPYDPAHPDFAWSPDDVARILATYEPILRIGAHLPGKPPGTPGRPREHPEVLYAFYVALTGPFPSNRAAAAWIRKAHNWAWLCDVWAREYGIILGPTPPSRGTCANGRKRMRDQIGPVLDEFRATALEQAVRQGLLTGPRTMADPPRSNVVVADGTVPKMRYKKSTLERLLRQPAVKKDGTRRPLPSARLHKEGGGITVFGEKFVVLSSRADDTTNSRVILDVRHCSSTAPGGEAQVATDALLSLRKAAPAMLGCRYDGALRGKHIDPLIKAGLSVVSPPHEGIKAKFLRVLECKTCRQEHYLGTEAGWLCLIDILDDGTEKYERLEERSLALVDRRGSYACYLTVTLPCGARHRERLDKTTADEVIGLNRTEHLRQHPKGSPVYDKTYGWRSDAESDNNNLDSNLYRHRMIVDDVVDQHLVMLGHALARNAMSAAVAAARAAAPPRAA